MTALRRMTALRSALYEGHVLHARTRPVAHRFRYPVSFFLFDLSELPELGRRLRLLRQDRPGLLSLHARDYGVPPCPPGGLEADVRKALAGRGIDLPGGRILLCTQARVLGYVFNPVSFFHCHDRHGRLRCVIAEVNNTWGERRRHFLDDTRRVESPTGSWFVHDKELRVSPFMPMDVRWRFQFTPELPVETHDAPLEVRAEVQDSEGTLLFARLSGRRRPLTDRALAWMLVRYPLMTLQIIGAIHLEALRLALKGVPHAVHAPPEPGDRSPAPTRDRPHAPGVARWSPHAPIAGRDDPLVR